MPLSFNHTFSRVSEEECVANLKYAFCLLASCQSTLEATAEMILYGQDPFFLTCHISVC